MPERRLPPWEEIQYFNAPVTTTHMSVASGVQVAAANPQRVLLAFSAPSGVDIRLSPVATDGNGGGWVAGANPTNLVFREKDDATLCTCAWFAVGSIAGPFTVTEVILRQWPDEEG